MTSNSYSRAKRGRQRSFGEKKVFIYVSSHTNNASESEGRVFTTHEKVRRLHTLHREVGCDVAPDSFKFN